MKIDPNTAERLLSSIPEPVFAVDTDMTITYMNRAAADFTGLSETEAIGRNCQTVFRTDRRDPGRVFEGLTRSSSAVERTEARFVLSDGREVEALLTTTPIFASDGAFEGGLAILRDVTEERRILREAESRGSGREGSQPVSMEFAEGLSNCFSVLDQVRQGNLDARVREGNLTPGNELLEKLYALLNDTIDEIQSQHVRVDEFHESSMELAMGLSECFYVLQEVRQGNLDARASQAVLDSKEELLASFGKALNDTTSEIQDHIETIRRQQFAIRELSTPILQLWDNVLALPVIGTVDTRRSAEIMELLLAKITETQSLFVILDITGVEVVDTKTADHFIKVVKAAELLGTTCLLTGMRPAVAQTLVDIGVDLSAIRTLRNLKEGLKECRRLMEDEPLNGAPYARNRE
jgi:rsbT co-antagonist protein RsbR